VLHHADIALYRAKELGRGRAELYTPEAQEGFDSRSYQAA
jgi:predicted signal transduction protein with EAL and GGDEF domain